MPDSRLNSKNSSHLKTTSLDLDIQEFDKRLTQLVQKSVRQYAPWFPSIVKKTLGGGILGALGAASLIPLLPVGFLGMSSAFAAWAGAMGGGAVAAWLDSNARKLYREPSESDSQHLKRVFNALEEELKQNAELREGIKTLLKHTEAFPVAVEQLKRIASRIEDIDWARSEILELQKKLDQGESHSANNLKPETQSETQIKIKSIEPEILRLPSGVETLSPLSENHFANENNRELFAQREELNTSDSSKSKYDDNHFDESSCPPPRIDPRQLKDRSDFVVYRETQNHIQNYL